ncbi:piezo-type mechanosensitive ion channel component 2-like [Odocoileus virginianus]|uniref:Piezo-type mechanosensitive ion channel component 2-like n=1 Tax=Odocoileus virginianus TaxID=9874 RepID=A0ABM4IJC5_ODOVR
MVSQRQSIHRLREGLSGPLASATLDTVTRAHLDHGLLSALQYFIHFGFYKFGLELCFVAALHTVGQRMDFYALIHIIWLVYLLKLRRRKAIAEVWPRYCGFLVCLIIFQYFLCLGLPPALCKDYPWRTTSTEIHSNLIKWLYLPDYAKKPDANLLFFDFLLLLAASLQWQVFVDENTASMRLQAGDNVEISRELRPADLAQLSPALNFIFCRSYLDMVKVAVFRYHFWFVLCLVFLAGKTRIHILSAGYLAAFGYFMLQGSHLLLQPAKTILQPWDCLVAYSALVVAVKTFLSVGACVYLEALLKSHCWLVHIFGLSCTVPGYQLAIPEDEACEPPEKEAGILWDAVCLTFLLIQRRIFLSYYHLYVVADLEAAQALASRGAELLALSLREALEHSEEDEKKCLWVITRQIEKIKAKQRKVAALQRGSRRPASPVVSVSCLPREVAATGPSVPDDLSTTENEEEKKWWQPWTKHPSMLQDGSYTFFETDSEEEEPQEESEAEITDRQPKPRTAFQLAYKAWTDGAACALRMRMEDEWGMGNPEWDEEGLRWRHSGGGERLATRETEAEARAESSDEPGRFGCPTLIPWAGHPFHSSLSLVFNGHSFSARSLARRLVTVAQLCRVLGQVLLDDVTEALRALGGDSARVSRALRGLRHGWWRAVTQLLPPTLPAGVDRCGGWWGEGRGALPPVFRTPGGALGPLGGPSSSPEMQTGRGPIFPGLTASYLPPSRLPPEEDELEQSDRFYRSLPRLVKLTFALHQAAVAKSETLCYLVIILNHTLSASILSMVLPILSFLWAMLSVPRPSKRFWMAAIYYTEATVVVKYFSQFGLFPWTTKRYAGINREKPFSLPNILGVEKRDGSVLGDLVQLLALFFHRNTLQGLGLWDQPPCDQAHCKGERKSRRQRRNASGESPGGGNLRRRADLDLSSQELPLSPPAPNWAFWRRWWATGHRGGPQDPGSRKTWSLLRKQSLRQKQLNRSLLETLEETGKLGVRRQICHEDLVVIVEPGASGSLRIYHSIRRFFSNLRQPPASPVRDVYTLAFLVEVLNLVIVLFGYWAFGKHSAANLAESLSEETVPGAFLAMVLVQFGTMLVDRALYLRKAVLGKCAFQLLLVIGTHLWLFFILPGVTTRRFNLNHVAQTWYLVKCIYFGLSAYQIRHGYPNWILGNCLTKNFSLVNLILFKGFRVVPFLLELRAVIDWMWTNTSLSLSNWTCLEDLYANIFIMKCHQESEKKYPQPPGRPQKRAVKYGLGGIATFALVFLMWFPLVFMSLVKTVGGVTNQPLQVSVKIAINGYETLFSMSAQQHNLVPFSDADYDRLTQQYALHLSAMQFLADYRPEDIVLAKIKSHASLLWGVSPTDRSAMVQELANTTAICITTSWAVQRNVSLVKNVEASGKHMVCYRDAEIRDQLVYTVSLVRKEPVMLPGLIPKALRTTEGTEVKMAHQLEVAHPQRPRDVDRLAFFRNATIQLQQLRPVEDPVASPAAEWWMVQEWRPGCEQSRGCSQDLELVIFNDKVSPQSLGFLAGYGIVGLYVSVVMVAAKFIRDHFLGIARSIMHDQLPDVDRVLGLCTDIFLVRELGELQLEQELFARLTFLYRSPETMIKWTRQCPPTPCLPPANPVAAAPVERLEAAVVSSSPLASEK